MGLRGTRPRERDWRGVGGDLEEEGGIFKRLALERSGDSFVILGELERNRGVGSRIIWALQGTNFSGGFTVC